MLEELKSLWKAFYRGRVEISSAGSASTVSKPVKVAPRLLVELGICSNPKSAYNTLSYLVEMGKAKRTRRATYLLYPGSSTYERVAGALSLGDDHVRQGFAVDLRKDRWWRWRVVLFLALSDGGVSPGYVARVLGVSGKSAWRLLEEMRREGLLRRVGRGWYVPGFDCGLTRVDSGGVTVGNRSVFGEPVHHPVLGLQLWLYVDQGRGGSVQVEFAFPGRFSGKSKFIAIYSYRHRGRWYWKIEPVVKAEPGDPLKTVHEALDVIRDLYLALKPLGRMLAGE